jgi:hypothetical protein
LERGTCDELLTDTEAPQPVFELVALRGLTHHGHTGQHLQAQKRLPLGAGVGDVDVVRVYRPGYANPWRLCVVCSRGEIIGIPATLLMNAEREFFPST